MDARTGTLRTIATSLTTTAALALVALPAHADTDHVVEPGDTVSRLAAKYGVPSTRIIEANELDAAATIYVGEHLTIPTAMPAPNQVTHVVVKGDTAWDLAETYGVTVSDLRRANSLNAAATIRIGQTLVVPGATIPHAATPAAAPTATQSTTYVVQAGDTLWSIARGANTTVSALAESNGLSNPSLIRIGQAITVPSTGGSPALATPATITSTPSFGGTYVVQAGDTVSSIASRHGTTVSAIATANSLADAGVIRIGQVLTVPGGAPTGLVGDTFLGRTYPKDVVAAANVNKATLNSMDVPSRSRMQQMVIDTANAMGVDPALAQAIAYQESGFNQRAVSPANAVGTMQVIPTSGDWASDLVGRDLNLLIAEDNVTAGVAILRQLQRNGTELDIAIAGYYQGETSVRTRGMNSDTVRYVASVKSLMERFD
ncbi:LysM peptidoglycan-binding domain-containing protein [Demequina sp. TTPB684]|uniref:lytic transglycosylase domain-containing protein n=1 Tax=unclassified Demequina TaxID=2620311 RepID=UPI001CF4AED4|nr:MULTISPECIES: lytic transglycosylase domain-containing protein [unclassified Demequina]MCB2413849.1 LysM peptidoglycan-binding domain-containing protein [Demequina sp. TTPB684]UPU89161.1 LysM peptidoglycan-binding domain-containing protein [Demequina sp. TMPB413]